MNVFAGQDHIGTLGDPDRTQRELHRVGPVADADTVRRTRELRELAFERVDLFAEDEGGPFEHRCEPDRDLIGHRSMLCLQIYERDVVHVSVTSLPVPRSWRSRRRR